MTSLWQDIKFGARILARNPGFTGAVLLVIGVGIGANTALFNAFDQVYMRPLPVKKPHELVSIQSHFRYEAGEYLEGEFSYPTYQAYRDRSGVFADLVAFTRSDPYLRVGDETIRFPGLAVSANYFSSLGVKPALGHLFTPNPEHGDEAFDARVVISHRLWSRRFGGRADVIGEQMILHDQPLSIIGVAPAEFTGTIVGWSPDVYLSLATHAGRPQAMSDTENHWLHLLGRLKPHTDRQQAQAVLQVLDAQMHNPQRDDIQKTILVLDGHQGYVPQEARAISYPLALFLGIAVLVLVIACANVANLQLARAVGRRKEIAVRQALGGGRRRIVRQLLVESLLLALAAGALGVVLAMELDRIICALLPRLVSTFGDPDLLAHIKPGPHPRVLLFATAVSAASGIAFGLTPALHLVRRDIIPALKESAGCINRPARQWNPHNLLVVGQIAVAVVVTVCSGLCLRNLVGLKRIDPGFDPGQVLVVQLDRAGWLCEPEVRQFFEDAEERVAAWPQVASTGLSFCAPLGERGLLDRVIRIEGAEAAPAEGTMWSLGVVSPGYFQTLGQSLLMGRDFTVHDGPDARKVMIVNEFLAQRHWPNQSPIGKRVTFKAPPGEVAEEREIVGVVKAVKLHSIIAESKAVTYRPLAQEPELTPVLLVRATGDPQSLIPMIREEVAGMKQTLDIQPPPSFEIRTIADRVWGLLLPQRILTGILNSFALVGLLLSATGIYAVMACAVRQRTREIGIRIALGAQNRHVLMPILHRGAMLLAIGLTVGLGLSLAGSRLLTILLPQIRQWDDFFFRGIHTLDLPTYLGAALTIVGVTLAACWLPARRAAKIDPMEALRYE